MKKRIKILLIFLITYQYSNAQTDYLNFKVSTNYFDGKPYLTKTKTISNSHSKVDIYFFKEHFALFSRIPNDLTKNEFKKQEIIKWAHENNPKKLNKNWMEIYTYDDEGKLIEYKYSGCTICSQFPWGFKLIYNDKNNIIEQRLYYLDQKTYIEKGLLKVKYELKDTMKGKIELTYDNNENIVKLEKIDENGIEELIELVK